MKINTIDLTDIQAYYAKTNDLCGQLIIWNI